MEATVATIRLTPSLIALALAAAAFPQAPLHAAGPASRLWTGGSNTWDTAARGGSF